MRGGRLSLKILLLAAGSLLLTVGCAKEFARWRADALVIAGQVRASGGEDMFPVEFRDMEFARHKGDELLATDEVRGADNYFLLALTKGKILQQAVAAESRRRADEARKQAEAARREEQRLRAEREELERRLAKEKAEAAVRERAEAEAAQAEARRRMERERHFRERPLPTSHTVKRGETLPQIAAQSDIYNDAALWPLLYRANRDQIRDPRIVWPGQVIRIPRNLSREELVEARRYSQEKPLR